MKGLVIKGIGGFYYVKIGDDIFECRGRGLLKIEGKKLAVGDIVELTETELSKEAEKRGISHEGVIESIYPRKNEFVRPPIVNVDCFIVTFAAKSPDPDLSLIDKFIIMAEMRNVECIILVNKADLADEEYLAELESVYSGGYTVLIASCVTGEGIDKLKQAISGKTVCFAGPSGVGKSTLINKLIPTADMETGSLSKISRGRHTTRHVEIFTAEGGGLVYDTPGFTSFEIMEAEENNLKDFFPEFEAYNKLCYFDNCRHINEPDCAVREAVKSGEINKRRYESYKDIIKEIKKKRKY